MYNGKFVSAVICAAGASSRMKTGTSKQLISLGDMTVLERTVLAFENDCVTDEIIIVCPESLTEDFAALFKGERKKPLRFARGGLERQISVRNGVEATSEKAEIIAVHDGARPFVTSELIKNVIADGEKYGCSTLAVSVKDTIKRVRDGVVVDTPPREELYSIQTPQVFDKRLYLDAYDKARRDDVICTDDCRLIELYGGKVHITVGSYNNIKITTPEDIAVAKGILENN